MGPPEIEGTRIEAEELERNGVGLEAKHAGFTGRGYVAGWNRVGQTVGFVVANGVAEAAHVEDGVASRDGTGTGKEGRSEGGVANEPANRVEHEHENENPARSWRTLTIRYAAGAGDAYRSIRVDGVIAAPHVLFVNTGRWDAYETVSFDVMVRPGDRVEIGIDRRRGDGNFLNLDSITIR
jgi:hypothetical protein